MECLHETWIEGPYHLLWIAVELGTTTSNS